MTTFRTGQDVAVVEHDDSTRQPREGGQVLPATVTLLGGIYVQVQTERYGLLSFYAESGWHAWDGLFRWRLVHVCTRCTDPILGAPVTDPSDPLKRLYCGEDCRDDDASAWAGQHYGGAVAT